MQGCMEGAWDWDALNLLKENEIKKIVGTWDRTQVLTLATTEALPAELWLLVVSIMRRIYNI